MPRAPVTIVMYHYVRNLERSRFKQIKGLTTAGFAGQIDYIRTYYNIISAWQLMDAISEGAELPPRSLLLTFDDGYMDHFTDVFPILDRAGISGCFFPPAKCILEHEVLEVNKIHFILARCKDKSALVEELKRLLEIHREAYGLEPASQFWATYGKASRFDSAEVVFCKRLLQHALPLPLRRLITRQLFAKHVTSDESAFSHELYMSTEQLCTLDRHGMYVGSHGYDHFWLNTLTGEQQVREIDQSLKFLHDIGIPTERWIMCYPYGGYNQPLLELLRTRGCVAGLTAGNGVTSTAGLADLTGDPLILSRIDTNDLPTEKNAQTNAWFDAACNA